MSEEEQKSTVAVYEIRLQGNLDTKWSEWFYDMTVTHDSDVTTLCGPLPDQTVLHSVLDRIRDMNLPLLSVKQLVADGQSLSADAKGVTHEEPSINSTKSQMDGTQKGETEYED